MPEDSREPLSPPDPPGHAPLPAVVSEYRTVAGKIAGGPFLPWMRELALWLCDPTETVTITVDGKSVTTTQPIRRRILTSDWTREASRLSGMKVSTSAMRYLRARPDFRALLSRLEESITDRAKFRLAKDHDFYVQAHRAGLEMALEARDHRAVAGFTGPILDRVTPKKEIAASGPRNISITVHQDTANRLLKAEETVVEAEFEVEAVPKGESDA